MTLSRRHFLRAAGAVSLGFAGLGRLFAPGAPPRGLRGAEVDGFGPLVPDPNDLMDLPAEFSYTIVSRRGEEMHDGFLVPARHDGMAAFPAPGGRTLLVRNHEVNPDHGPRMGPFGPMNERLQRLDPRLVFDAGTPGHGPALGGTTTLLFDTRRQELVGHRLSLTGTLRNCAGGPTPWGTWLTCEENVRRAGDRFAHDHGWVFEIPATVEGLRRPPEPLRGLGRFYHEAVAVDPASGAVYLTEDRSDGVLYRFLPRRRERLAAGGRLQALVVVGRPGLDTRNWAEETVEPGARLPVRWIDLDGTDSPDDDLRYRAHEAGAALFARGEGIWQGEGAVYVACTNGGPEGKGQIWKYVPSPAEGTQGEAVARPRLELFVEADEGSILENADNLTLAPWGDLFACEDGSGEDYVVGITPEGSLYHFARNARNAGELAGACFSPDGSTLFVNIQSVGVTLAITGPWERRGRRAE